MRPLTVVWLKRDLRSVDHAPLTRLARHRIWAVRRGKWRSTYEFSDIPPPTVADQDLRQLRPSLHLAP